MNLILEGSSYVDHYTYLDSVFEALPQLREMNWLITDLECKPDHPRLRDPRVIIDGTALHAILQAKKLQFPWGVFSGFRGPVPGLSETRWPHDDGHLPHRGGSLKPQARGAVIEITCSNSCRTLFVSENESLAAGLRTLYPDIREFGPDDADRWDKEMEYDKSRDWLQFYPDVKAAGSLQALMTRELPEWGGEVAPPGRWGMDMARFKKPPRDARIHLGSMRRLFSLSLDANGATMAYCHTPHLEYVIAAINGWLSRPDRRTADFCSEFPWVGATAGAAAFEEGREVEWAWQNMLHLNQRVDDVPMLRPLIERASREPRLRMLYPYLGLGLGVLCFSRCTGRPYTKDTPIIVTLHEGQYQVRAAGSENVVLRELGRGDVETAVRLTVENLPPGIGPAYHGLPKDDG